MPVQERGEPTTIDPTGIICPKDPNRSSDDPKRPPTHLSAEILKIEVINEKKPNLRRATFKCNTCGEEWVVNPYPPRDPKARGDRVPKS
jgi:hypothetical protein